ncbi:MAG: M42 family metallopeptidase [Promethearchaeota archaeon]
MTFKEDFQLIKDLTEIQGCTGNEAKIRQYIFDQVKSYCDNIEIDTIGNLICHLNGKKNTSEPKHNILLDAHMDEIGFMVRYIDKDGFIRFVAVGGQNARILPGQTVVIHSSSGKDIIGVIGEKAIHLISKDERKKVNSIEDLFIDVGLSSDKEMKEHVAVGDYITFKQECHSFITKKRIFAKALDNRLSCFILIKLIKELASIRDDLDKNLIFLFAVQEEIGVRGATVGAYKLNPDFAIALDVTHAIDYPGVNKDKHQECYLGCGAAIAIGPNLDPKLTKALINVAREEAIPFVLEAEARPTPTDARAIQMTKAGIPCALIGTPLRYMHTNIETFEYEDALHVLKLLKSFLLKKIDFMKLDG